jgi:outer membrane murein-binding lipoprotein Lpp
MNAPEKPKAACEPPQTTLFKEKNPSKVYHKRRRFSLNKLAYIAGSVLLAGCIYVTAMNDVTISYHFQELNRLNRDVKILEELLTRDRAEMQRRTDPAAMSQSIMTHFERELKESPDQVRGADGKYPRER